MSTPEPPAAEPSRAAAGFPADAPSRGRPRREAQASTAVPASQTRIWIMLLALLATSIGAFQLLRSTARNPAPAAAPVTETASSSSAASEPETVSTPD